MFQILHDTKIPFMSYRRPMYIFSALVVLATIGWLIVNKGPRYSVDFTGGTLLQVQTSRALPVDEVRHALDGAGLKGAELQASTAGTELLIRIASEVKDPYPTVANALTKQFPDAKPELRRQETVGPKVGSELRSKALWAVLFSLGGILLYVGLRY